ncbi:PREDICTED: centrosomal protein of 72 kDa [Poecilia mexicana]|uniref:U2A'/phosphoprotein 32 family A C-terminal domain-containing protein n=1 Tax=Poecilia mexicana TaxID=48701 RepID=A0A3B3Z248_9TELE|nr:PREDICTED: centrosomal protein of 72 kDa [Poecilia mexicana]
MAAVCLTTLTEQWIRDRLQLKHPFLGDVRTLSLPGTHEEKIRHLGSALNHFCRLKSLDLSYNAIVSLEGVKHLKKLERLILYYNCIPSLEKVQVLYELPALRELDLRLNPLTKNCPGYRPHLVHAMPNLRKLDNFPVRDMERKAAILEFSTQRPSLQQSSLSLDGQLGLGNDIVLNFVEATTRDQGEADSLYKEVAEPKREEPDDFVVQRCSTPKKELAKSILRYSSTKNSLAESKDSQMNTLPHNLSSTSPKGAERPKVSFGPVFEKHKTVSGKQKQTDSSSLTRHKARGHFTANPAQSEHRGSSFGDIRPPSPLRSGLNLADHSNPVLHPARLTYSSFNKTEGRSDRQPQAEKKKKGGYRKPLEMLLNLVDKHWRGERSLHYNNSFLSQAVQILSMMESNISSREAEVRTLRQDVNALRFQALSRENEHRAEVCDLSAQLEEARREAGKLNEQLRIVLEENVALQKQLIKLERQYLKSMMKSSPVTQIREAQTEVEELRKEIEGLRKKVQEAEKLQELSNMLQESHRSLVATNECLLAELRTAAEH